MSVGNNLFRLFQLIVPGFKYIGFAVGGAFILRFLVYIDMEALRYRRALLVMFIFIKSWGLSGAAPARLIIFYWCAYLCLVTGLDA
jgi:hypothetical protein